MLNSEIYIPSGSHVGAEYITSNFPSGEVYIKITHPGILTSTVDIHYRWTGDASLIMLLAMTNALRLAGVNKINLYCPYFPGARSDRVGLKQAGEALSVKVYTDLINVQGYNKVVIFDPHSDVVTALLDNVVVVPNYGFVKSALFYLTSAKNLDFVFVSPDAGANKKIDLLVENLGTAYPIVRADKKRDVSTGKLVKGECVVYVEEGQLKDKVCIIVDDICSRGGTFIALASELKRKGAKKVILAVSHYEGGADPDKLSSAGIDAVYTTTSLIPLQSNPFIQTFPIEAYL